MPQEGPRVGGGGSKGLWGMAVILRHTTLYMVSNFSSAATPQLRSWLWGMAVILRHTTLYMVSNFSSVATPQLKSS